VGGQLETERGLDEKEANHGSSEPDPKKSTDPAEQEADQRRDGKAQDEQEIFQRLMAPPSQNAGQNDETKGQAQTPNQVEPAPPPGAG